MRELADDEPATGRRHPKQLSETRVRIADIAQTERDRDRVELAVGEREMFGIRFNE